MTAGSRSATFETVRSILAPFDRIDVAAADEALFRQFRSRCPQLVSCLDDAPDAAAVRPKILAAYLDGTPAGVASWVRFRNDCRKEKANLYARIDLVIVSNEFRGLGIARLLTLAALLQMIETHGERLYSVSCLAAHPAMQAILEPLGFAGEIRAGHNFKHESIRVDRLDINGWGDKLAKMLTAAGRVTNYHVRQNERVSHRANSPIPE